MRTKDDKSDGKLISAALLAVVVALVGLAGAVKIAQSSVNFGPAVGDIITFDPSGKLPRDLHTQVAVARNGRAVCVLDLATVHRDGGSLIVEQRAVNAAAPYRVHWAGKRSSQGAQDCGASADLLIDESNLDLLAMAAGGWGVSHKHLVPATLWSQGGTAPATRAQ